VSDDDRTEPQFVRMLLELRDMPDVALYVWLRQARKTREENPGHVAGLDLLIDFGAALATERARAAWDATCADADMRAANTDDTPPESLRE